MSYLNGSELLLRIISYAENFVTWVGVIGTWLTTKAELPLLTYDANGFIWSGQTFELWFSPIEMLLGGGITFMLGWRLWKFLADGIGL